MREIKFRAWMENKMLSHEDLVDMDQEFYAMYTILTEPQEDITFMQFTGLKDKDGREIFEGDLYKFIISHDMYNPESGHTTFEVVHVKAVTFEDGAFYHGTHLLSEIIEFDDSFTYVGNIYENPELLEESQNGTK